VVVTCSTCTSMRRATVFEQCVRRPTTSIAQPFMVLFDLFLCPLLFKAAYIREGGLVWFKQPNLSLFSFLFLFSLLPLIFAPNPLQNYKVVYHLFFYVSVSPQSLNLVFFFQFHPSILSWLGIGFHNFFSITLS
jgi:hypothetical protein